MIVQIKVEILYRTFLGFQNCFLFVWFYFCSFLPSTFECLCDLAIYLVHKGVLMGLKSFPLPEPKGFSVKSVG